MGFACIFLDRIAIDQETVRLLPSEVAVRYKIAPLKKDGSTLWCAMADPANEQAQATAEAFTGCQVVPVMVEDEYLTEFILKHYGEGI